MLKMIQGIGLGLETFFGFSKVQETFQLLPEEWLAILTFAVLITIFGRIGFTSKQKIEMYAGNQIFRRHRRHRRRLQLMATA